MSMRSARQLKALKKWLIDLDMTQQQIAASCGVTQQLVSMTVRGRRRNQMVIDFFLSRGCPRELLDDGGRMRK